MSTSSDAGEPPNSMQVMPHPFDDARLLYERARRHIDEFNAARDSSLLWKVITERDAATGEYVSSLNLARAQLVRLKPIAADAANNLIHALDQVLAACARLHGSKRSRNIYFLSRDHSKILEYVGNAYAAAFARARDKNSFAVPYLGVLKEISNAGKHWALTPSTSSAHGVGITTPQGRTFVDIPFGHFEHHDRFEFSRTSTRPTHAGLELLIGLRFEAVETALHPDPVAMFQWASQYVMSVIEEAEAVAATR